MGLSVPWGQLQPSQVSSSGVRLRQAPSAGISWSEAGGKRLVTVPEQIPPQLQSENLRLSKAPTLWLLPGLLLPPIGLMVVLSEGKLWSLLSLSFHSRDMASSSISLRCGCEGGLKQVDRVPRK